MKNHKLTRVTFYDRLYSKNWEDDPDTIEYGSFLISNEFPQVYAVLNLDETGNAGGLYNNEGYITYFLKIAGPPPYTKKKLSDNYVYSKMDEYHKESSESNEVSLSIDLEETDLDSYKGYLSEVAYVNTEYESLVLSDVSSLVLLLRLAEKGII